MTRFESLRVGLGLRRSLMPELDAATDVDAHVDFFEVAPENWLGMGGRLGKAFRRFSERFPIIAHGLSLSLGGPDALDEIFLQRLKGFLDQHGVLLYSEHLSYCSDGAHLYDLLPIPFTADAVQHVAGRIRRTQEILERRIAVENASFYTPLASELTESEFVNAIVAEADCDLLLDVNNVYVNSVNHRYDARAFIDAMPAERVRYLHIAGHYNEAADLIVDTHGADVIDPVWSLLDYTYARIGARPTLLERDFNVPPLPTLYLELEQIRRRHVAVDPPLLEFARQARNAAL